MLSRLWGSYNEALKHHPVKTNVVTAIVLCFSADVLAQRVERQVQGYDYSSTVTTKDTAKLSPAHVRTLTVSSWGASYAFLLTYIYRGLDRRYPAHSVANIVKKVVLMATCMAPPMNALFFGYTSTIEHFTNNPDPMANLDLLREEVHVKLATRLVPTVIASAEVWMPVNFLNWWFLAGHYRTLSSTVAGLLWNMYLSMVGHRPWNNHDAPDGAESSSGFSDTPSQSQTHRSEDREE